MENYSKQMELNCTVIYIISKWSSINLIIEIKIEILI